MKKLIVLGTLLMSTFLSAQDQPDNYDGGSELFKEIQRVKKENPTGKSKVKKKPVKKHNYVVTHKYVKAPDRTPEEAAYYNTYGTDSPSYLKKLMNSEFWKLRKEEAERTSAASEARLRIQREQDSITTKHKNDSIAARQLKYKERVERKNDSMVAVQKLKREQYLEKIREEQKNNKPRTIFTSFKRQ